LISQEDFATNRRRRLLCGALTLQPGRSHARSTPQLRTHPRELVGGTRTSVRSFAGAPHEGLGFRELASASHVSTGFRELVGCTGVGMGFRELALP
jgi:hypothetical protein